MVATDNLSNTGTGSGKRIPALEGLRGVLALGALVYHVAFMSGVASFIDQPGKGVWGVMADGLGVVLPPFFVLSGMFLFRPFARVTISGSEKPSVKRFFSGRVLRLLPGYWLALAVGLLAINLNNIDSLFDVVRPIVLVHFYFFSGQPMIGLEHTWTVTSEFTFYLILPLVAWLCHRYARNGATPAQRARRMAIPIGALALIGFAWVFYTNLPSFKGPFEFWFWPLYFTQYFALGLVLAIVSAYAEVSPRPPALYRWAARWPSVFFLVALGAYIFNAIKPIGTPGLGDIPALVQELTSSVMIMVFAVGLIVPLTLANVKTPIMDAVLANPPVRWLGRISYGVYLWHVIIIEFWFRNGSLFGKTAVPNVQWRGTVGFWELLAFTLSLSVLAAAISYYLLERPVLALRYRRARPTSQPEVATSADPVAPVEQYQDRTPAVVAQRSGDRS